MLAETSIRIVFDTLSAVAESLPEFSESTVLFLHLFAIGSIGTHIGIPFVSFKGGIPRVGNKIVSNRDILIFVAIGISVIVLLELMIESIYDVVVLTGYQALGVGMVAISAKVMKETGRNADIVLGGAILVGVFLLIHPVL